MEAEPCRGWLTRSRWRCGTTSAWADTIGVVEDLNARFGVTVTASDDTIRFDPRGFGLNGTAQTITVARGAIADTVFISAFGRIQQ